MYKASIDPQYEWQIDPIKSFEGVDMASISEGRFHILKNNKTYNAELVRIDTEKKVVVVQVNGTNYTVTLKDEMDLLLDKMGISATLKTKINELKAPMPGLVLEVKVAAGDVIPKGGALLILEAMKMENVLKSTADVRIKSVEVKKGDIVEKNQILIKFE